MDRPLIHSQPNVEFCVLCLSLTSHLKPAIWPEEQPPSLLVTPTVRPAVLLPLLVRPFILLVFTFLSLPQLLLFIDPTNIYRVHIIGISQTLFPQEPDHYPCWQSEPPKLKTQKVPPEEPPEDEDTEHPSRKAAWSWRHRRPLQKSCPDSACAPATNPQTNAPSFHTDVTPGIPLTRFHWKGSARFPLPRRAVSYISFKKCRCQKWL